jgi:hypothetical protein
LGGWWACALFWLPALALALVGTSVVGLVVVVLEESDAFADFFGGGVVGGLSVVVCFEAVVAGPVVPVTLVVFVVEGLEAVVVVEVATGRGVVVTVGAGVWVVAS